MNAASTSFASRPSAFCGKRLRSPSCSPPRTIIRLTQATPSSTDDGDDVDVDIVAGIRVLALAHLRERLDLVAVDRRFLVAPRVRTQRCMRSSSRLSAVSLRPSR